MKTPTSLFIIPCLAALVAPAAGNAQKCSATDDWFVTFAAQTVCGCTQPEAEQVARRQARVSCATAAGAVACAPLVCAAGSGTRCETVVTGAPADPVCRVVPATTLGCPANCVGKNAVECVLPEQRLQCDCACRDARCEAVNWSISRRLEFCAENTERGQQKALAQAYLTACGGAANAEPCPGRTCPGPALPGCRPVVRGDPRTVRCVASPLCPANEIRCTFSGPVNCSCRC
jgi:hypothetical protein